ncbi:hypothetical protein BK660_27990 [Pseudomonas brassicacearum]|uniref:Uncharacterized protein n=1 Tax=Pseudomonas brassicacearum TaxID=930166 RepID=A0A423HQH5_9PSED|nr:hypothetical protein [Pseudomonas brassicacearum]RON15437.1 hypothetical protein BK660_27990 [Pseudomonas brassicacearum]
MASVPESAHYRAIADALEEAVAKKIDRIAQMLNCPVKGEELRRAITESRKDFLLNQPEAEEVDEEDFEDDEEWDDDLDWTTE